MPDPIILRDDDLIAQGSGRIVYGHPDRPDLVIKLHKHLRDKPFHALRRTVNHTLRRFGRFRITMVEVDEYFAMVARTGHLPDFTPAFRGLVETDRGVGTVFDRVVDGHGNAAPRLGTLLRVGGMDAGFGPAIDRLWDRIVAFRAVVSDPNLSNVLVTREGDDIRLHLVDGLGEKTWIKVRQLSDLAYVRTVAAQRREMHAAVRAAARGAP